MVTHIVNVLWCSMLFMCMCGSFNEAYMRWTYGMMNTRERTIIKLQNFGTAGLRKFSIFSGLRKFLVMLDLETFQQSLNLENFWLVRT